MIISKNCCHSPCGSVDWNRHSQHTHQRLEHCHSPCGSVDWNIWVIRIRDIGVGHSPCGSVDWNQSWELFSLLDLVTPLAGVWIEIFLSFGLVSQCLVTPLAGVWIEIQFAVWTCSKSLTSLPLRECGLKCFTHLNCAFFNCHSPCGSVDWNYLGDGDNCNAEVTPLAGVWIEIKTTRIYHISGKSLPLRECGLK